MLGSKLFLLAIFSAALSYDATASTFTVLHPFSYATDGDEVRGSLVQVGGRLYGLAGEAGPNGDYRQGQCDSTTNWDDAVHTEGCPGTLFSLNLDGTGFRIEHAFTPVYCVGSGSNCFGSGSDHPENQNFDGYHPYGSLALTSDGKLHGVTREGGIPYSTSVKGQGVLFTYDPSEYPSASAFAVNHYFCESATCPDGAHPTGSLAVLSDGESVAGTATDNGDSNYDGTVFLWNGYGSGFSYVQLHSATTGGKPNGGLTAFAGYTGSGSSVPAGAVGMTYAGPGSAGHGAAFFFNPSTMTVTAGGWFPSFGSNAHEQDNTPIQTPVVASVYSSNDTIYFPREYAGAATGSGSGGTGQWFKTLASGFSSTSVLFTFDNVVDAGSPRFANASGAFPNGNVATINSELFYGTTLYGGAGGAGAIYYMQPQLLATYEGVSYSFDASAGSGSGGSYPYGGLLVGSDGALYGTTFVAGAVFRYSP